jgi:peptide/nickel transport system permease protein
MAFFASFIIRRLAQAVVIIFLVTILIFTILRIVPGDPVRLILGPMATQETLDRMAARLGLKEPIIVQYSRYMKGVLQGDFGTSFTDSTVPKSSI